MRKLFDRFRSKKKRYVIRIPRNRPIGKIFWTVQWFDGINAITFRKKKDAVRFQELLKESVSELPSVIVRREVTEEGYEPTYNGAIDDKKN